MSKYFNQDSDNAVPGRVTIDLVFTAGASGAVPSTLTVSKGITSVTKSTNDYLIVFDETYLNLLGSGGNVLQASVDNTKAFTIKTTAANASAAGGATATISPYNAAGTAQPLVSGDIVTYEFCFQSVPI